MAEINWFPPQHNFICRLQMWASTKPKNSTVFKDLKSESENGENAVFIDEEALTGSHLPLFILEIGFNCA